MHIHLFFLFFALNFFNIILIMQRIIADILSETGDILKSKLERVVF